MQNGHRPLVSRTPMNPKGRTFGVVDATEGPASPHLARTGGVARANLTLKEAKFGYMHRQAQAIKMWYFYKLAGSELTQRVSQAV